MNWILFGIIVLGVIILKIYQEEPEEGLLYKLFGYTYLGAFKFLLQGFPFPLGFIAYGLFLHPKTNITIKKLAATLGLGIFFLGILIPVFERSYFERIREMDISSNNLYTAKLLQDWLKIKKTLDIQGDPRLENFKLEYEKDGKITTMGYEVTTNNEGKYVHYNVMFSPEKSQYLIYATRMDQGVYKRLISVERFFEVFQKIDKTSIKLEKNYAYHVINYEGQFSEYGEKDTKNFILKEEKFEPLSLQQLPIQGFFIRVSGMVDITNSKDHYSYEGYIKKVFIFQ